MEDFRPGPDGYYLQSICCMDQLTSLQMTVNNYADSPAMLSALTNLRCLSLYLPWRPERLSSNYYSDDDHDHDAYQNAYLNCHQHFHTLQKLTSLSLAGDLVQSLEGITLLTALRVLSLQHACIKDITALNALTGLRRLTLPSWQYPFTALAASSSLLTALTLLEHIQ